MNDHDEAAAMFPSLTPRGSIGSGLMSFSSSSVSPSTSVSGSSAGSSKTAVSDCLGAWLHYFQILNGLCSAGYRLAQTISALEQWGETPVAGFKNPMAGPNSPAMAQFVTNWDDLARATAVATSTVKSHIVNVLQDFVTQSMPPTDHQPEPIDLKRIRDHNQQIIMETTQTMINIQHQFCVASYESFSTLMCCFVCQASVGYPHDPECAMLHQQNMHQFGQRANDPQSQTASPKFGSVNMSMLPPHHPADIRQTMFGSTQASSTEHIISPSLSGMPMEVRGPSPIHGFLDNIRGPLPNPGNLLGMKAPPPISYHRGGSRSPLNCPLFPLVGQRRWSEAAAGEVRSDGLEDSEANMRRWSMPWEASVKSVIVHPQHNTVAWHQTRVVPGTRFVNAAASSSSGKSASDRSQSGTPDSIWHSSAATSQDGLAEAIQLLSFRPARLHQHPPHPPVGQPFIEETHSGFLPDNAPAYEMWSDSTSQRLPCIKFNSSDRDDAR